MLLYIHMFWVATVILGYSSQELNNDTTLYLFHEVSLIDTIALKGRSVANVWAWGTSYASWSGSLDSIAVDNGIIITTHDNFPCFQDKYDATCTSSKKSPSINITLIFFMQLSSEISNLFWDSLLIFLQLPSPHSSPGK